MITNNVYITKKIIGLEIKASSDLEIELFEDERRRRQKALAKIEILESKISKIKKEFS